MKRYKVDLAANYIVEAENSVDAVEKAHNMFVEDKCGGTNFCVKVRKVRK